MSLVKGLYILRGNTAQPVSESPFSGDELASKDSFHFPVPNTTTLPAFPNLPPILQGHLTLSDDYTGNRNTEITVNLNSANS